METVPDTLVMPFLETTPARHSASTAHLLWQIRPPDAGLQDEQDAPQGVLVWHGRPSSLRLRRGRRQKRCDAIPKFRRQDFSGHPSTLCILSARYKGFCYYFLSFCSSRALIRSFLRESRATAFFFICANSFEPVWLRRGVRRWYSDFRKSIIRVLGSGCQRAHSSVADGQKGQRGGTQ